MKIRPRGTYVRGLQASAFFVRSHELDLFQFGSFHSKKGSHPDNLPFIHEVLRIRAELFHRWAKTLATHSLRYAEAEPTFTTKAVMRT